MRSITSKVTPTDIKIITQKNVKYCAKEINGKCFNLPFTHHVFYQMMSLLRLRCSRDLSPNSSSTEWTDENKGVMIIVSTKNTPQGFNLCSMENAGRD